MPTFIRVIDHHARRELLLNVGSIDIVEVVYQKNGWKCDTFMAQSDPEASRCYRVVIAGQEFLFESDPNSPVLKVFDDIYKAAIKTPEPPAEAHTGE